MPLPVPAFGGGSLADVMPAVLALLDVPGAPPALPLDTGRQVCVLLVDGLGWNALGSHADTAPFLAALRGAPGSRPLTSVAPTTTPIALTSFGTGLAPGEHGITGLMLRLDEHRTINTLALPAETDLARVQPRPTVFERADGAGVAVTRVGPRAFDGDGLTQAALRGGRYAAAEGMGERIAEAVEGVRRGPRSLTYVYVGDLDATGHRRGVASESWRQELAHVDAVACRLAQCLPAGATLLVTSDHGMVDVPMGNRHDLAQVSALREGVVEVSGDLRLANVHTRAGAATEVVASWAAVLGDGFWVGTADEAITAGLYGPVVTDEARARIGDVLAVALTDGAIVDSARMPPEVLALTGLHGSVTADELLVPLLVHAS